MFVLLTKLRLLIVVENEYFKRVYYHFLFTLAISVASQGTRSPSFAYKKEFASDKSLDTRVYLSLLFVQHLLHATRDVFPALSRRY